MAIKVTTPETKQDVKPFPKLMVNKYNINTGIVVLFIKEKTGIVVRSVEFCPELMGNYAENWNMSDFTDYNEPVTIQNA